MIGEELRGGLTRCPLLPYSSRTEIKITLISSDDANLHGLYFDGAVQAILK